MSTLKHKSDGITDWCKVLSVAKGHAQLYDINYHFRILNPPKLERNTSVANIYYTNTNRDCWLKGDDKEVKEITVMEDSITQITNSPLDSPSILWRNTQTNIEERELQKSTYLVNEIDKNQS